MPDPETELPTAAEHRDQSLEYLDVAGIHFNEGRMTEADLLIRMASVHSALAQSAAQDELIRIQTGMADFLARSAPPVPAKPFHWEATRSAKDNPQVGEHIRSAGDKRAAVWRIEKVTPTKVMGKPSFVFDCVSVTSNRKDEKFANWMDIVVAVEDTE